MKVEGTGNNITMLLPNIYSFLKALIICNNFPVLTTFLGPTSIGCLYRLGYSNNNMYTLCNMWLFNNQ